MDIRNCSTVPDIGCIIPYVTRYTAIAVGLIGTVSLFLIIAAGIKYVTSGGGKAVEEAKNMITYAIIGLVIVLLSFFIVNIIAYFTGVSCIANFGIWGSAVCQ